MEQFKCKKSNLLGRKIGTMTVVKFSRRENKPKQTRLFWICQCECGVRKEIVAGRLLSGRVKTCGGEAHRTHYTETPGYSSLKGAIGRCYNRNNTAYADYGGRGVRVCDRWRFGEGEKTGFQAFLEDMGSRPEGLTLDRIDTDGDYEPSNCRWADKRTQQQNQRRAILSDVGGVHVPLKKYARRLGLCYESIRFRVRKHDETVSQAVRGLLKRRRVA